MKKFIIISLAMVVIAGLLTGCGKSLEADRDTVYIQKKGNVVSAAIADFDKDYYDEEELKKFHPSMDVNEAEDAIYSRDLTDVTDILKEMLRDEKKNRKQG